MINKFCQICMSILDPETHYSRFSQLFLAQAGNELCIHFILMHILMSVLQNKRVILITAHVKVKDLKMHVHDKLWNDHIMVDAS
jgi:hypothetical protein